MTSKALLVLVTIFFSRQGFFSTGLVGVGLLGFFALKNMYVGLFSSCPYIALCLDSKLMSLCLLIRLEVFWQHMVIVVLLTFSCDSLGRLKF